MKVRANLSTNDGESALEWALQARGILMRSQRDLAEHVRHKRLVPVLQDWKTPAADIYVLFQTTNELPAKIRALVDLLVSEFEPYRRKTKGVLGPW